MAGRWRAATAVLVFASGVAAGATSSPPPGDANVAAPEPLVEVVSFGATPVAGADASEAFQPKPGDIIHRAGPTEAPGEDGIAAEARVHASESWPELAQRLGVPMSEAARGQADLLPALVAGKYVQAFQAKGGRPAAVEYVLSNHEAYTVTLRPDGVSVLPHASDPRIVEKIRADPSKASLFTATDAIGLPDALVLQLVDLFAGDIDFYRELHYGYRCSLVYEVIYRHGYIDRPGRILAAEFVIRNRTLQAYYFDDGAGHSGYYTPDGRSMKKLFLRNPVQFSRVTSDYTLARFHPILGIWRAHRGTDYAAPVGTAVLAVADGQVEFAGERGELGNLVVLDHFDRYQTYYGHLRGFANGLRPGEGVKQGQVIGYVGMTGLTTGPHLHYEFHVKDANGDWASVPEPQSIEAPRVTSPVFFAAVKDFRGKLTLAAHAHIVTLD